MGLENQSLWQMFNFFERNAQIALCSKYLLHKNLLETYLSRSTRYQDQPGLTLRF